MRQRDGLLDRLEPLGILDVEPLGPFEEGEMPERGFPEGQQLDPDTRRVAVGGHREVWAGEPGPGTDGRQEVLDEREVEHLLLADLQQRVAPALDRLERLRRDALADALLEREGREQVLEHDEVLELGRLPERVDERLAILERAAFAARLPPADRQDVGQRSLRADGTRARVGLGHRNLRSGSHYPPVPRAAG